MNNKFERKRTRLANYDYTETGYYFITICTKEMKHYFGEIVENNMHLTPIGQQAYIYLRNIQDTYNTIKVDKFVIMPNHIHLILGIKEKTDVSIPRIVKQYKECVTKSSCELVWHKSYHDHLIRNEQDYLRIWKYIDENVLKWELDKYYS